MTLQRKSLLSLLLAAVFLLSFALSGCSGRDTQPGDQPDEEEDSFRFINTLDLPAGSGQRLSDLLDDLTPMIAESYGINEDVVGWLRVPGTDIDDVVVHYPGDNNKFYLRRGLDKRTLNDGTYFADYRNQFDGTAEGLSRNTVIYGHSFDDNKDGTLFSQTKRYLDEDFARENPYLYFSVGEENMLWEVFAVYYATVDLPYNIPEQTDDEYFEMINEVLKRSIYTYDTQVTASDKILTLSTCTYIYTTAYPNDYRYVVMARLVGDDETVRREASFEVNPAPKGP